MIVCTKCGTELESNMNFCPECGMKIRVSTKDLDIIIKDKKVRNTENFNKLKKNANKGNYSISGRGKETLVYMEDNGIKTGSGLFIPYNKITFIDDKSNISKDKAFTFGLIGLAYGLKDRTVEIIFTGGKIVISDVKKDSAHRFIQAVQNKIINS